MLREMKHDRQGLKRKKRLREERKSLKIDGQIGVAEIKNNELC